MIAGRAGRHWHTFRIPVAIAALSAAGLAAALFGDGPYNLFSWAALGVPVVVAGLAFFRPAGGRVRNRS